MVMENQVIAKMEIGCIRVLFSDRRVSSGLLLEGNRDVRRIAGHTSRYDMGNRVDVLFSQRSLWLSSL